MSSREEPYDVLVAGAGPAGASVSTLLARAGARVAQVTRPRNRREARTETLAPAARRVLTDMGLSIGEPRPLYAVRTCWEGADVLERPAIQRAEGPSFLVERPALEDAWNERALSLGLRRFEIAGTPRVDRVEGGVRLCGRSASGDLVELRAARSIDASGARASHYLKLGGRTRRVDAQVVLELAWPRETPGAGDGLAVALLEALPDCWIYVLPDRSGGARAYLFTLGARLPRPLGAPSIEHGLLGRSLLALPALREAGLRSPPRFLGAHAFSTSCATRATDRAIPIGDAAIRFDPLASQGLLSCALTARRWSDPVAVERLAGVEEYHAALAHIHELHLHELLRWIELAASRFGGAYWSRRRAELQRALAHPPADDARPWRAPSPPGRGLVPDVGQIGSDLRPLR